MSKRAASWEGAKKRKLDLNAEKGCAILRKWLNFEQPC
jgi:hypothetical protein